MKGAVDVTRLVFMQWATELMLSTPFQETRENFQQETKPENHTAYLCHACGALWDKFVSCFILRLFFPWKIPTLLPLLVFLISSFFLDKFGLVVLLWWWYKERSTSVSSGQRHWSQCCRGVWKCWREASPHWSVSNEDQPSCQRAPPGCHSSAAMDPEAAKPKPSQASEHTYISPFALSLLHRILHYTMHTITST